MRIPVKWFQKNKKSSWLNLVNDAIKHLIVYYFRYFPTQPTTYVCCLEYRINLRRHLQDGSHTSRNRYTSFYCKLNYNIKWCWSLNNLIKFKCFLFLVLVLFFNLNVCCFIFYFIFFLKMLMFVAIFPVAICIFKEQHTSNFNYIDIWIVVLRWLTALIALVCLLSFLYIYIFLY